MPRNENTNNTNPLTFQKNQQNRQKLSERNTPMLYQTLSHKILTKKTINQQLNTKKQATPQLKHYTGQFKIDILLKQTRFHNNKLPSLAFNRHSRLKPELQINEMFGILRKKMQHDSVTLTIFRTSNLRASFTVTTFVATISPLTV